MMCELLTPTARVLTPDLHYVSTNFQGKYLKFMYVFLLRLFPLCSPVYGCDRCRNLRYYSGGWPLLLIYSHNYLHNVTDS